MKKIIFIRHSKSNWEIENLTDFNRSLSSRGEKDAPVMGAEILERVSNIQHVFSSSSIRTRQTVKFMFGEKIATTFMDKLYLPSVNDILELIHQTNEKLDTIAIVSHNPATTKICNQLQNEIQFQNIPTSGCVCILFDVEKWNEIQNGKLEFYSFPKKDKNYLVL
ncbi:MAG: SixA phosphatase family protein [Bacteroidia bacterium]